ncbi:MAG TPA: carboxypeptidase regulatory-like domain-containing protein [Pyrinomonadaceae bacterium]|jgi:protocatechuate 3,4-dioxygenase beta subunit|nr:carboxypeptidase regulatory-like domain-containing protein [Pyrinomonadaceae bacterium]
MTCVKRLLIFSLLFAIALSAQSWSITNAQTPDTKPRATASITGRVTIGDKPAPGVIVVATTLNYPQMLVAQALSDADGKYRLSGLAPGQINVSAAAPTFVMPTSPMSFNPGRVLSLSTDEAVEGIDFKMTRGSVITGRVVDADGKPVIGERLMLTLVDEKGAPMRNQVIVRGANPFVFNTDDRGIYRIYGLPAGRYKVSAGDNGGGATLRAGYYQKTYHPDTTEIAKAAIVELGEGSEAKNIDITLGPRSRTYTVSGKVIDGDTGEPIAGINYAFGTLTQIQTQTMMAGYTSPSSPTNSKGEFILEGVVPGKYAVMTMKSGLGLDNQPKVYSDPVPFEVTDADVSDVEIKAHRGLIVSGIVVTDAITNRAALAGVSRLIVASFNSPPPGTIQTSAGSGNSAIGPDGSFQIEGLRPGKLSFNIGAVSAGESRGYSILRVTAGERELPNRQLELSQGQNVSNVRVYVQFGTGVVRGEVKITGGTLPPESSLMVWLQTENPPARIGGGTVDSRGRFLVTGVPAGTYDVVLQVLTIGPGFGTGIPGRLRQTVTVTDDAEAQMSFTLDLTKKEGP